MVSGAVRGFTGGTERNAPETPSELVPEHLVRVNQSGVDGIWSLGGNTFHFVEAKFNESAGAMFGRGHSYTQPRKDKKTGEVIKEASKLAPPTGLTERQLALWHMLGQPKKGLQMGRPWLKATVAREMGTDANIANRWVYAFFAVPSSSPPKDYTPKPGSPLKKHVAGGSGEHVMVSGEVAERFLTKGDIYELALHDQHKPTHAISDEFGASEIDVLNELYEFELRMALANKTPPRTSAPTGKKKGSPSK